MSAKDAVEMNDSKTRQIRVHKEENIRLISENAKGRKLKKSIRCTLMTILIQGHSPRNCDQMVYIINITYVEGLVLKLSMCTVQLLLKRIIITRFGASVPHGLGNHPRMWKK